MKKVLIVMMALCFGLSAVVSAEQLDGKLLYELYEGIGGGVLVSDLTANAKYPDSPDDSWYLEDGFLQRDIGMGNFGARITGYIIPSVTASDYVLYILSDDASELYLSTDTSPGNARLVAKCGLQGPDDSGWAPIDGYNDSDVVDSGELAGVGPISLKANTKYYVMALYKEGGGGDHCQVAWESTEGNIARGTIPAENVTASPYGLWKATSPTPADDALDIPVGALTLSWDAPTTTPDPVVKYNVHYGLSEADIVDPNGQSLVGSVPAGTTEFIVDVADVNLEYFWRVDVLLSGEFVLGDPNAAVGDVWSFESFRTLPLIDAHPTDVLVYDQDPAMFAVVASPPLPTVPITGYEWFMDGGSLIGVEGFTGADTDTLSIPVADEGDEGEYYCIVTNSIGTTQSTSATLKTKNLVAHYEFEEFGVFEGKMTVLDSAPYHGFNDGIIHGGAMLIDNGVLGKAIEFNGIDQNVTVGQVGISGNVPRTIACWVKATDLDIPNYANIFGFSSRLGGSSNQSFDFNQRGGQNRYCIHVYGWERNIRDITFDWHHLVGTYDGNNTISWYVNGRQAQGGVNGADSSPQTRGPLITEDNVVMAKRGHQWRFFPGQIDDARIYDYELNPIEVAQLYGLGRPDDNFCINPPAGDIDGDCDVDLDDLLLVVDSWLFDGIVSE